MNYLVKPAQHLHGTTRVPGDKSISHRSIMLGSLAEGITEITGFLNGADCLATARAFAQMGIQIDTLSPTHLRIHGRGLHGLSAPNAPLDVGNSGTSMRLMSGILAAQPFNSTLIGDASLTKRPMRRVTTPLTQMGAKIETSPNGTAPLRIIGGQKLCGITYDSPVVSAQVKSCLLLAGLYADGETCVIEHGISRDHTERMLRGFGFAVQQHISPNLNNISENNLENNILEKKISASVRGGGNLRAMNIDVPADISSAAFVLVAAAITPNSEVCLQHVGINPSRTGVIEILRLMGAEIELTNVRDIGGEPVADIWVRGKPLRGIVIPTECVPVAIDEFPALFIAAACAEGETVLTNAEELRVKESDRIAVMATGLARLGVDAQPTPDGIRIQGNPNAGVFSGGEVETHDDHRIAMSFAVASLRARGEIRILDCENVNTSFPDFVNLMNKLGLNIEVY